MVYSETVSVVTANVRQRAQEGKDIDRLQRGVKGDKTMEVESVDDFCDFCQYEVNVFWSFPWVSSTLERASSITASNWNTASFKASHNWFGTGLCAVDALVLQEPYFHLFCLAFHFWSKENQNMAGMEDELVSNIFWHNSYYYKH